MTIPFKHLNKCMVLFVIACLARTGAAETNSSALETDNIRQEGMKVIEAFSNDLKHNLKSAIKEGGLTNGIEVCALKAPQIALSHSQQPWQVKRTSLKVRNPVNAPTAEELDVLEIFESGKAGGKKIHELSYYRVTVTGQQRVHHLMQAIPTQALCLGCHGEKLAPEVQALLHQRYPEDQATGFQEGDIRGAFSLFYTESLNAGKNH